MSFSKLLEDPEHDVYYMVDASMIIVDYILE